MQGFTLIEIMVVLAIVALMVGGGRAGVSIAAQDRPARGDDAPVGRDALPVRSRVDDGQDPPPGDRPGDRDVLGGGLGRSLLRPARGETPEQALREREEKEAAEDEDEAKKREQAEREAESGKGVGASSSFDLSKLEVGDFRPKRARFAAFKDLALKPVQLKKAKVRSVYTPRVTDPLTAGRAYIYFFPLGQTEPAIVTLSDMTDETRLLAGRPPDHRARPASTTRRSMPPRGRDRYDDQGNAGGASEARGARPRASRCSRSWSRSRSWRRRWSCCCEIVTNNVRATNHAKLTTAATFLARTQDESTSRTTSSTNGFSSDNETDERDVQGRAATRSSAGRR